jgi:regulator of protease activity HflC (stomatin/prohibitin superfamily)
MQWWIWLVAGRRAAAVGLRRRAARPLRRHARRRLPLPLPVHRRPALPLLSLKEQALDIPEQVCITRDNVQVGVDGVLYLKVMNPERASYGVQDYFFAISQLAQTTLRSEVGKIDLDRTFEERAHINRQVVSELDKASEPWGVKVLRYEIKNIVPPKDVLSAMEKQMRAEREKRAVILTSEGERDARINEAEGEKQQVIKASEAARQQQINEAEGQASGDPGGRRAPRPRVCAGRRDDPEPGRPRGGAAARRRAVGRPVRVQTPLLPEYAGLTTFQQPQLSPDGSAAFILAPQWSAVTGGLLSIETQPGGRAKFLASALRYWIVQKGPWSGNLIVHQNPILVGGGRLEIYYMLDRTGKEIGIVGTSEDSVKFLLAESEH